MLAKYAAKDLLDLAQLRHSFLNNGVNLRCALDLAVSTFALDHPLPVSIDSRKQTIGHPGRRGRDKRWRKFVGSISRLESFSSKKLSKKFVAKV